MAEKMFANTVMSRIALSVCCIGLSVLTGCNGADFKTAQSDGTGQRDGKRASESPSPTTPSDPTAEQNVAPKSQGNDATMDSANFDEQVAKAESLINGRDLDGAWKVAKNLMIERPEDVRSLFLSARVLALRGDLRAAIQLIGRIDPENEQAGLAALGQIAEWLAQSGDLVAAEAKLRQVLKKVPAAVPANRLLIDIYSAQGRRWESARLLDRLVRIGNFTEEELMKAVDYRESYDNEALRTAAIGFAPDEPYSRFGQVRLLVNKNRWAEVVEQLQPVVTKRPELLEPWIWYGEALWELGHSEEVQNWLSNRPEGFAGHPEYWYVMANLELEQGRVPVAARCFIESIRLDRRHVASMNGLSECLLTLQMPEAAQRVRDHASALVRINNLVRSIHEGRAASDAYQSVASTYAQIEDAIGAFAWQSIIAANEKQPMSAALLEQQRAIRNDPPRMASVFAKLPIDSWPLPNDESFEKTSIASIPSDTNDVVAIRLNDVAAQKQLDARYVNGAKPGRGWYIVETNGGGVSAIDYDRDGWPDLFFSQAGALPTDTDPHYAPKQLYRSLQSESFSQVAGKAQVEDLGYGQGTGVADMDQDGFSDILVANIGSIALYRNQGDGTFERVELPQAGAPWFWNSAIQAADVNGDTLPDIVQGIYIKGDEAFSKWCPQPDNTTQGVCHPRNFQSGQSRLLFNGDSGEWIPGSDELHQSLSRGYTLGTLITNIDQRNGNDVYFANDISPNCALLSRPASDGRYNLVESAAAMGVAVDTVGRAQGCMGLTCGDQDRNGLLDIIVTNNVNEGSTLYLQTSPGVFIDGTRRSNLGRITMEMLSFGAQLIDLDNDGWLDLVIVNGLIDDLTLVGLPWKMLPQVIKNNRGHFEWLRKPSPGDYFTTENSGRGLTLLDYNRDGKLDCVATHLDRPCALLENNSVQPDHHFLQLETIGTSSERDAIGAIVHIKAGNESWTMPVSVGDGFFGTNEHLVHVGLGRAAHIDELTVDWPSGKQETYRDLKCDQRYLVIESISLSKR